MPGAVVKSSLLGNWLLENTTDSSDLFFYFGVKFRFGRIDQFKECFFLQSDPGSKMT